jgi:dihydrofolate reductase
MLSGAADRIGCTLKVRCMAKLIYTTFTSLDGYTKDDEPDYDWGVPVDEELQSYLTQLTSSIGTYLYGQKTYESDLIWETGPQTIYASPTGRTVHVPLPQFVLDQMRQWQSAEKIVYSRTLTEARSARTRIEREFNLDAVRRLKADAKHDICVDPELAAQAIGAGLVDEFQMIVNPVITGGGTQPFPNGVRVDLHLVEQRRFGSGVVVLRYTPRDRSTELPG